VTLRAPAKVNLHLEVLRLRPDGYHDIETILQAVTLFDRLKLTLHDRFPSRKPQIDLIVRPAGTAPADGTNLCCQAVRLFCREMGVSGHIRLDLAKEIPCEAGLGGGSSNAAAALIGCNQLFGTGLEISELEALLAQIGSDAPFFVRGGTLLGRGRGSDLTPLPAIGRGYFLLIKPEIQLKTSSVYAKLKMGLTVRSPKATLSGVKSLIARFPTSSWFGFNRLEEVVFPAQPALQRMVLQLRELAPVAMLSGSGSAAFAVFPAADQATEIAKGFARFCPFVRIVVPHAGGVEFTDG
jgi:4-diphosphocytidyl-2-C-methyl-D-erythritol kinase